MTPLKQQPTTTLQPLHHPSSIYQNEFGDKVEAGRE